MTGITEQHRDKIAAAWDEHLVKAEAVGFAEDSVWVDLSDGRRLGVPLAWFPRLLHASPEQRADVEISTRGLHWEELDEDISVDGLLAGRGDQARPKAKAAAGQSPPQMSQRHMAGAFDVLQDELGVNVPHAFEPHQPVHDEGIQLVH